MDNLIPHQRLANLFITSTPIVYGSYSFSYWGL